MKGVQKVKKTFAVGCIQKERKKFFSSLNPSFVKDSNLNKGDHGSHIKLVEGNKLLQDDQNIANELNTFFKNAASNLNINENTYIINHDSGNFSDRVDRVSMFVSINSTQAFYLSKASWKIISFFLFNPYQNLTWRNKFKIMILKRQLLRTLSHLNSKNKL